MAKTIKEMAHDHVVTYMHNDEYEDMEDTFIVGANAILDEIEKFATATWCSSLTLSSLKKKIKELKGE